MKYYIYWYCFLSRVLNSAIEPNFLTRFRIGAAIAGSSGLWGLSGLILIQGILKFDKSIVAAYGYTFLTLYILFGIFDLTCVMFRNKDTYERQLDEMPPNKRKLLWWIFSFLTIAPFVLFFTFIFIVIASKAGEALRP